MLKSYAVLTAALACFAAAQQASAQTRPERIEVENEVENEAQDAARAEVRLTVPRKADGTVDTQALLSQVKTAAAGGAREIQLRDRTLTDAEMQQLLSASFLSDLAKALPSGPGEHQIRIRGATDIRVQMTGNGALRVRIEKADLTAAQRDALIQQLRTAGFDRVRIDGGPDRANRGERNDRVANARPQRAERVERPERSGRN
jgi:hypothetical protein